MMIRNWSIAKSRRTATYNETLERKYNPLVSRQREIAVKLKEEGQIKVNLEKVYLDEQKFLEIESSLDGSDLDLDFENEDSKEPGMSAQKSQYTPAKVVRLRALARGGS